MANNSVYPLPISEINLPKMIFVYNWAYYGHFIDAQSYIWYIEGPKENIIIDTGVSAETAIDVRGFKKAKSKFSVDKALEKFGLKCGDIDTVIITHLHWDHADFAYKFPNANFIIQKKEFDFALNPHPLWVILYDRRSYKGIDFLLSNPSHCEIIDNRDFNVAEGVRTIFTPGHTPGNQSVLVETSKGKVAISGSCSIHESYKPPEKMKSEVLIPGTHFNCLQAYDSMIKIKKIADVIVPNHEPELPEKIPTPIFASTQSS